MNGIRLIKTAKSVLGCARHVMKDKVGFGGNYFMGRLPDKDFHFGGNVQVPDLDPQKVFGGATFLVFRKVHSRLVLKSLPITHLNRVGSLFLEFPVSDVRTILFDDRNSLNSIHFVGKKVVI